MGEQKRTQQEPGSRGNRVCSLQFLPLHYVWAHNTCGGTTHIQGGSCLILTGNTLTDTPSSVFYNSVNQVDEINRDNCIQRYVLQKGFGRSSVAMCALNPSTWEECEGSRPAWVILARPCLKKPNPMNLG